MKVIVAGMPKTGTKTMTAALRELGLTVYDVFENFEFLEKDWLKIFNEGGTTEDFRRMFKSVDAVADNPSCYFWDEIHKAYPEAKLLSTYRILCHVTYPEAVEYSVLSKYHLNNLLQVLIVLTIRNDEEAWCQSLHNQFTKNDTYFLVLCSFLSPTLRRLMSFGRILVRVVFGFDEYLSMFKSYNPNMSLCLMTCRRHNSHVLQTAPKDKLLVFDVREGWDPLCKFLGVEAPDKPFPHENKNAEIADVAMQSHPVFLQAKKEILITTCCLSVLFAIGGYQLIKNRSHISHYANVTLSFLTKLKFW